jgi:dihydrodipicolinate synthase/N-acetylneuraminate lyase
MIRYPSCIMACCVVPWDDRHYFVEDLFRHQVRELLRQGTQHLYLFGTASEGYAVTDRQYLEIATAFSDEMRRGGAEPMIGVISLSLPTIVERIAMARDLGVRRFQISLPSWGPLSDSELATFFRETCGRFSDCTFLHYNLMRTKRLVTPKEYGRLAQEHPHLVATKNRTDSMDRIYGLLTEAPQLRHFLTETGFVYGSLLGECGLLISLAATNWKSAHAFFDAGRRRDAATLVEQQHELLGVLQLLLAGGGGKAHMDGAFDKMLWKLYDERFPLRLLPPYEGASDEGFAQFRDRLRERYPRWTP